MVAALIASVLLVPPRVVDGGDAIRCFPDEWRRSPYDLRVTALQGTSVVPARAAVQQALMRYGQPVYLPDVVLVSAFSLGGREYGGTYYLNTIYIACSGADDKFVRRTVHHEFSSILLRNYQHKFNKPKWLECNPSEFLYGSGGYRALGSGDVRTTIDKASASQGFVSAYAKASLEEDFNLVAENLFEGGPEFWRVVDSAPRLKAKVEIAVKFYETLDPALTEAAFRNHSQY